MGLFNFKLTRLWMCWTSARRPSFVNPTVEGGDKPGCPSTPVNSPGAASIQLHFNFESSSNTFKIAASNSTVSALFSSIRHNSWNLSWYFGVDDIFKKSVFSILQNKIYFI